MPSCDVTNDLIFGWIATHWKNVSAKTFSYFIEDIEQEFDFNIDIKLILKAFLFLFRDETKQEATLDTLYTFGPYDTEKELFISYMEQKWACVRESFTATFKLIKNLDLDRYISKKNYEAVLPIVYFIYHKNLAHSIVDSEFCAKNRKLIKKYFLRALFFEAFAAESTLINTRKAFTKNSAKLDTWLDEIWGNRTAKEKDYIDEDIVEFPLEKIEKMGGYVKNFDDEYIKENIINKDCYDLQVRAIFFLIYDDFRDNVEFEICQLYNIYDIKESKKMTFDNRYKTGSLLNHYRLENLDKPKNNTKESMHKYIMERKDMLLKDWVEKCVKEYYNGDREKFLKEHFIPDVDLSLENYEEFFEKRKKLLLKRIKEVLNS